jgi:glucosamine--fructose-6-phosphate aminotransferase (isomerizing)
MARPDASRPNTPENGKNQMNQPRNSHPYHFHDAVMAQPALLERVFSAARPAIERAAVAAATKKRIVFVGIGTSLHAAQVAEHFLRHLTAGRADTRAEQSFEFVRYPLALAREDAVVVITHTGTTSYSVESLRAARKAGALTVAITGEGCGEAMREADHVITTCEQEVCFAYTKSYSTALAGLALFAIHVAERRGASVAAPAAELARVPEKMRQALATEARVREIAKQVAARERLVFFGAGPNWATALEGALKVKEASYVAADASENEQILHGPFSELDSRMALVALLACGPSDERARTVLRAAAEVGALRVAFTVPSANRDLAAEHIVEVPAVEEWLSPLILLVPVQWLTYFVALEHRINPDTGRQDQAPHARAHALYKL